MQKAYIFETNGEMGCVRKQVLSPCIMASLSFCSAAENVFVICQTAECPAGLRYPSKEWLTTHC